MMLSRSGVVCIWWNVLKRPTRLPKNAINVVGNRSQSTVNNKWLFATTHERLLSFDGKAKLCTISSVKVEEKQDSSSKEESFKQLLDNSKFVQAVDPVGRKAVGEIIALSGDSIYVDFGSKFHAVVARPKQDRDLYIEGAKVIVQIKDLEMTDHFLGAKKHISLLEAEAELVGLIKSSTQPSV